MQDTHNYISHVNMVKWRRFPISTQASPHPIPWFAEIAVFIEIIRSKYQLMNYKNKLTKYYRWTLTIFQELVSLVHGPSGPVGYLPKLNLVSGLHMLDNSSVKQVG